MDGELGRISASLEKSIRKVEEERGITFITRPTFVDASQCKLIAILQARETKRVLAARAFPIAVATRESSVQ